MSYSSRPTEHRSMVFDTVRNKAYYRAVAAAVDSTSRVLDLGARKVYLVDPSAAVRSASILAMDRFLASGGTLLPDRAKTILAPVSPLAPSTHWRQVFFPFRAPLDVQAGDHASLWVSRPQHGEWSWIIRFKEARQAHSTAMSAPLVHSDIASRTESAQPQLNERGRAISLALQAMDGTRSIGNIAAQLLADYPAAFTSRDDAIGAITRLAQKFAKH